MRSFALTSLLALSAIAFPTEPTVEERDLVERQGTGTSIFVNAIIGLIKGSGIFGGAPPVCDGYFDNGITYYFASGQASNGLYWQACWQNDSDTTPFGDNEVAVANCLTNLHYTQADTCISTEGSECDNGYVAGGGRLQNLREPIIGSGTQGDAQINADESAALQAAVWAVDGQNVKGLGGYGPFFILSTDDTYTTLENDAAQMQVNWIGETAC